MSTLERPDRLDGKAYDERLPDGRSIVVSVNDLNGKPYEVFVEFRDPDIFEWVVVTTRLISAALREGVPAEVIADELTEIDGPKTGHYVPGSSRWVGSHAARIGIAINKHLGRDEHD